MRKYTFCDIIPNTILLVFSTTFYVFMNDNDLDYFQITVMLLATLLFLAKKEIFPSDLPIYTMITFMFVSIVYTKAFALVPFCYSVAFCCCFLLYKHLVQSGKFSILNLLKLIKFLIYAYGIVIILQQIARVTGMPIINGLSAYTDYYRFNSLSNEPSHTSRILLVLMISYMYIVTNMRGQKYGLKDIWIKDKMLWGAYLYTLLTSGSATAFLVIPVTFLYFLRMRNIIWIGGGLMVLIIIAINYVTIPAFLRIKELMNIVFLLDPELISLIDLSAAARINPPLYYVEDFSVHSLRTWLGWGYGYAEPMLIERVLGHPTLFTGGAGGVFPVMFYNYGLLSGCAFLFCLFYYTYNKKYPFFIIIWFLFFFATTFNSYMQWLYFCLAYSTIFLCEKNNIKALI